LDIMFRPFRLLAPENGVAFQSLTT